MKRISVVMAVLTALLAAMIFVVTAYVLHIPVGGGYIHLGDTLVYISASLLPPPYAMAASAVGGMLGDVLSGEMVWVLPTAVIKALMVLPFSSAQKTLLCRRNRLAIAVSGVIGVLGYAVSGYLIYRSVPLTLTMLVPDVLQVTVSGIAYVLIAAVLDRGHFKQYLLHM